MKWENFKLKQIADYWTGKIDSSVLDETNYVSTDNLIPDKAGIVNSNYVPKSGRANSFSENDVLISNIRPYFRKIWFANKEGGCSNDVLVFRAKENVEPLYLYYQLSKDTFFDYMVAGSNGTKMPRGNKTSIMEYQLQIPPLPTQRRIASILSAYDDLIENNLKRIKLLEEKAFLRYKLIVKSEKFNLKAFSEVADYLNGYPFKPNDWKNEGFPIIKIKELKAGVQNDTPKNDGENIPEKYFIDNKDILFAWSASIGAYLWCSGKSILNQHIFNVKPFDKDLHNWLYFSLLEKIPDFINLSNGATMQHIKKSALGMVYLTVPPKKVYEEFQKETDPILNLIVNLHQQNTRLRESRDILLPKLMNGQIEV